MLHIEDLRDEEANKKLPGPDELGKVTEKMPGDMLLGVRRIVLFDDDSMARKEQTLARHRPIEGRNQAEVDIFYDRLRSHDFKGKDRESYALAELTELIFECLYTHQSVTRHLHRRLGAREERRRAESFARARCQETLAAVLGAEKAAALEPHIAGFGAHREPGAPVEAPAEPEPPRATNPAKKATREKATAEAGAKKKKAAAKPAAKKTAKKKATPAAPKAKTRRSPRG
jgi:hypothetical protein